MKKEQLYCDLCGKAYRIGVTVEIPQGREMDASGNGYNEVTKKMDVCSNCVVLCTDFYIKNHQ